MKSGSLRIAFILCALLCFTMPTLAETRGSPYTPDQLHKMSTLVFEGTVLEIKTTDDKFKKTFPVKAKVSTVLKGKLDKNELSFKHKHPGRCVIFEKEFNVPEVEQEGTFYLQDQSGTLVLIGYLKKTEESNLKISYDSSRLTIIEVSGRKLDCTYHTFRKDLIALRTNMKSYDTHNSKITLTNDELEELRKWAKEAIKSTTTEEQKKSRKGYYTKLSVELAGKTYEPNHSHIKALKAIIKKIVEDRRKEGF